MTTIYLIRHSHVFKNIQNKIDEYMQLSNEKDILSPEGELRASKLTNLEELCNIDYIYSSNYVRAMSTAKYISEINNIKLIIDSRFGEREFGINSWEELPDNYFERQEFEENYKLENGESRKEVTNRMYEGLMYILEKHRGKKIVILSHGNAISFLFNKLCKVEWKKDVNNKYYRRIYFNGNLIYEGNNFNAPEVFKLIFDEKELISIENINMNNYLL